VLARTIRRHGIRQALRIVDLALAETVAQRAAGAIENARL